MNNNKHTANTTNNFHDERSSGSTSMTTWYNYLQNNLNILQKSKIRSYKICKEKQTIAQIQENK